MATGGVLEIDEKFIKQIEKADKALQKVSDTSNSMSSNVINWMKKVNTDGVIPFYNHLKKLEEQYIATSATFGQMGGKYKKFAEEAAAAADAVNKLSEALAKSDSFAAAKRDEKAEKKAFYRDWGQKQQYEAWLEQKHREKLEHERTEEAKRKSTQRTISEQQSVLQQREKKNKETLAREQSAEDKRYRDWLEQKHREKLEHERTEEAKTKATKRNIERQTAIFEQQAKRQEELRRKAEEAANRDSQMRSFRYSKTQSFGDTSKQATAAYNRLYSDKGVQSLNNMNKVLHQLQDAQRKLNLNTDEGKRKYEELEKKIRRVKKNLTEATTSSDSFNRALKVSQIKKFGDTSKQAIAAYDRLYGSKGVQSVNNMNKVLHQLQDAQNKLNLRTDEGKRKYNELGKKIQKIQGDINKATDANDKFKKSQFRLLNTTGQLQRKLALLFSASALIGYMNKLVAVRKEFELQHKSLQIILQSKEEANKIWQQTQQLALVSPFSIRELIGYTKQLAAYRIETNKLHNTTKMLADVSAGVGVDMQRLILAYGQVRAASFLRATELRQFTEAGVPLLEELATSLSEVHGRFLSVGDAMEMISKRQVSFKDVESVFQKMTGQGGVFYKMQEQQAQTIFGLQSNLKDAIDMMYNDIGQSNEGFIKAVLNGMIKIVKNWRELKNIVGSTFTMSLFGGAGAGLAKIIKMLMDAKAKAGGLRAMLASIGKIGWVGIISAVAGLVTYLALAREESDKLQEEIQRIEKEMSSSLQEAITGFRDLANVIRSATTAYSEKNQAFEEMKRRYSDILPDIMLEVSYIKQMASNYNEANEALRSYYNNKAREQKKSIIDSNFLEQEMGLVEDFMDIFNDRLFYLDPAKNKQFSFVEYWGGDETVVRRSLNMFLDDLKKGKVTANTILSEMQNRLAEYYGVTDETFKKFKFNPRLLFPVEDAEKFASEYKKQIASIEGLPSSTFKEHTISTVHDVVNQKYQERLEVVSQINAELSAAYEATKDLHTDEAKNLMLKTNEIDKKLRELYSKAGLDAPDSFAGILDSAYSIKEEMDAVGVGARRAFLNGFTKGSIIEDSPEATTYVLSPLFSNFEEFIKKEIQKIEGGDLKQSIMSLLYHVGGEDGMNVFDNILYDESMSIADYRKVVEEEYNRMADAVEKYKTAVASAKTAEEKEDINLAHDAKTMEKYEKVIMPKMKQLGDYLGVDWKKGGKKGQDSPYPERIRVINELVKKYKELRETVGDEEAINNAFLAFKDAFADAYKGTKWGGDAVKKMSAQEFMTNILNFPNKDAVVLFFDDLAKTAEREQDKIAVQLAKGEYVYEMKVEAKTDTDDALKQQIEGMFSDYELSLDLEKLDFPPDLAKQLFNLDTMDLESLRKNLEKLRPQFVGKNMEKEYEEYLKKVSEMEDKAQLERLKKYSKYLVKGMSERVKIKTEELRQIREVENESKFTKEQKSDILSGIQKETQKKLDKQAWEVFKGSDMYTQLFGDVEHLGIQTIRKLKENLENLKSSLKDLDASEVKEIMTQINKLEELEIKYNPFKAIRDSLKVINELKKEGRTEGFLQSELAISQDKISESQGIIDAIGLINNAKREGLSLDSQSVEWQKQYGHMLNLSEESLSTILSINKDIVSNETNKSNRASNDLDKYAKARSATEALQTELSSVINLTQKAYGNIKDILVSIGVDADSTAFVFADMGMSLVDIVAQAIMFQLQLTMLTAQAEVLGVAINSALGPIGWVVMALQVVATLMSTILGQGDKDKEKQIQALTERVKDLERAFEDLEKATQASYNIDAVNSGFDAMKSNIQEQINATEQMIQLEEDKKDTDHGKIAEWKREIEDYQKQLQELEYERINQLGGIAGGDAVKSASENFVNAWIDAFKETGDGLSGLEEQFDEVFMNLVKKQVLGRGVDKMLEPLFANLDGMLKDGAMDAQEYEDFNNEWNSLSPQINEFLTKMVNDLGIADDITKKTGELSGLQSGIQGITEDQADILAAYWSSVRFIVSNIEQQFTEYARQMLGSDANANPILGELKVHTRILEAIDEKLGSIIGYSGGAHVKTYLMSQ